MTLVWQRLTVVRDNQLPKFVDGFKGEGQKDVGKDGGNDDCGWKQ